MVKELAKLQKEFFFSKNDHRGSCPRPRAQGQCQSQMRTMWVFRYYDLDDRTVPAVRGRAEASHRAGPDPGRAQDRRRSAEGEHHRPLDGRADRARGTPGRLQARRGGRGREQDRDPRDAAQGDRLSADEEPEVAAVPRGRIGDRAVQPGAPGGREESGRLQELREGTFRSIGSCASSGRTTGPSAWRRRRS